MTRCRKSLHGFIGTAVLSLALIAPSSAATGDPASSVRFQSLGSFVHANPGATSYRENFDAALGTSAPESGTGTPFPRGWYGTFSAKAASLGTVLDPTAKTNTWCQKGDGVRNFANRSLYDTKPTANANNQNTNADRSLGVNTKSGTGEDYPGTGSAAFGLNLKTIGYDVGALRFDFTSFSITDTKAATIGDPVPVGLMLNWSVQVANTPSGPWATVATITHSTQLGGSSPGGVFTRQVNVPDLAAAVAASGTGVLVNNTAMVHLRVVATSTTAGPSGTVRASYTIDNFELGVTQRPGFVYAGEDDIETNPDARFDYVQSFNGLDATPLNAVSWSQGWRNDGNVGNRYNLKGWYTATTTNGVLNNRFVSGNGYIYTFERTDAGAIDYDANDRVIYNNTGGPPAVVNFGGVSGADNIANRNLGFRFSHEGEKNRHEAFYLGFVYTNTTGRPVTGIEADFYLPYWQRMGTPAWVRMDFAYKRLGANFDPLNFKIHEITDATAVGSTDAAGRHVGLSYLQFEHKGGLSSGTSFPKNDSQSWSMYGENMSAQKNGTFTLSTPLPPGESILLLWSTRGNGIDYGAHILAIDNVKLRFITSAGTPVALPPVVLASPASQQARTGEDVRLGVWASGTGPFTYQWRRNGQNLSGATGETLILNAANTTEAGSYDVVVSNAVGAVTSAAAQIGLDRREQTISFAPLLERPFTAEPISLSASTSSGLPLNLLVQGPALIEGGALRLLGSGWVTVRAEQTGDADFLPATPVEHSFRVRTTFGAWQRQQFTTEQQAIAAVAGPLADPGQSGTNNLLRYALGLQAGENATTRAPELLRDGADWLFSYQRANDRDDVVYSVEISTDLQSWTGGLSQVRVATGSDWEIWQTRYPRANSPQAFFRLSVSL